MSRRPGRAGVLGIAISACGPPTPARSPAPVADAHRDEPADRSYYALVGLPRQSFTLAGRGSVALGEAWIALDRAPYALVTDGERVELLSPLPGADIPAMKDWDEPMGTVRRHLTRGDPGQVETTFALGLDVPSRLDDGFFPAQRSAELVISLDPSQACDPNEDRIASQIVVRQRGCFLETDACDAERTLAVKTDGTYQVGPVRVAVSVLCVAVAYLL